MAPQAPLDCLETVLARCRLNLGDTVGPVAAGLFGYLAYDLKDGLEDLPEPPSMTLGFPSLCLFAPSLIVVHDKTSGATEVHAPIRQGQKGKAVKRGHRRIHARVGVAAVAARRVFGTGQLLKSNFTRSDYTSSVERIREDIAAGDVYQVNLSQRFEVGFGGDSYGLSTPCIG